ncbi:major facilitator superfamily transporter [Fusarium subglutinans]|uniref:Major facilitator superfamily transporter n=1 Tax=Gibberella subglutinans TaxID=42677 RepID=A0A8H5PC88_GIBSU|nr:major facilitator superfamily transporter [Fusarium subglutinans]KAF5593887.1 major facilitator superfamily transporter [Fusarium subglutinans]
MFRMGSLISSVIVVLIPPRSTFDGFIVRYHPWRYIYYVAIAIIGFVTILVYLTFPETAYIRKPELLACEDADDADTKAGAEHAEVRRSLRPTPKVSEFLWSGLKLYNGTFTEESLWKMIVRPVMLLALPPVLWATLVMSVTIGFITAITSNVAPAFATAYGFEAWQSGLAFFAAVIGAFIGMFLGGSFSDWVAEIFTRRNGGIREPEFRLPAIMLSVVCGPLALVLYGVVNFCITQATNISLVYTIDCYRPIAGEIVVTQLAFKSAFGFLLGFYTNPWVNEAGHQTAYGIMGAICGGVLIFWIPLFFWGHKIRVATLSWGIMKYAHWDIDREVGE